MILKIILIFFCLIFTILPENIPELKPLVSTSYNDENKVKEVNAMCSQNGITASITFDKPFTGKIFSLNYPNTHECIYFNGGTFIDNPLLFTIPVNACGTRITKNTRNIIDSMENQIYVQMNRYTQTIYDHQYSFICELALDPKLTDSFGGLRGLSIDGSPENDIPKPELLLNYRNLQFPLPHKEPMLPRPIKPIIVDHISRSIDELNKEHQNNHFDDNNKQLLSQNFARIVQENLREINNFAFNDKNSHEYRKIENGVLVNINSNIPTTTPKIPPLPTTKNSWIVSTKKMNLKTTVHQLNDDNKVAFIDKDEKLNSTKINLPVTKLVANQTTETNKKFNDILLEIQRGEGPYENTVNRPLKLGETLTLVIKGKSPKPANQYNMFVHSCFASGGSKEERIPLIDRAGCPVNSQVVGKLQRTKNKYGDTLYYFKMKAFKFPGVGNVFFSCSVDTSSDTYPDICPNGEDKMNRLKRTLGRNDDKNRNTFVVSDNVQVEDDNDVAAKKQEHFPKNKTDPLVSTILSNYYILIPSILLPFLLLLCCCICLLWYCRNVNKSPNKTPRIISPPMPKVPSTQRFSSERGSNSLPVFSFDKVGKRKMSIFTETS